MQLLVRSGDITSDSDHIAHAYVQAFAAPRGRKSQQACWGSPREVYTHAQSGSAQCNKWDTES